MIVHIYATRELAQGAIDTIDAARNPDGTEDVTLSNGSIETRPAKTWAHPIELEDGRFAVTAEDPNAEGVSKIVMVLDAEGEPVILNDRVVMREAADLLSK